MSRRPHADFAETAGSMVLHPMARLTVPWAETEETRFLKSGVETKDLLVIVSSSTAGVRSAFQRTTLILKSAVPSAPHSLSQSGR